MGRSPTELARSHGISRTWIYELVKRFRQGGDPALEPRSRRPLSCPHQHGPEVERAILALRKSLADAGHDAGAQTIAHQLHGTIDPVPAVSTIWRILSRHGLVTGLGIVCKHSTPYHPQTCGTVERFHQSLKRYLARQAVPESLAHLQLQLDTYRAYYNQQRPHRALGGRTPLVAFKARLRAKPAAKAAAVHFRVRHDRVDTNGTITLRYESRLRHIAVGRSHKHERVRLLIAGDLVRVIREAGSLIRELTLDPGRDDQSLQLSSMS